MTTAMDTAPLKRGRYVRATRAAFHGRLGERSLAILHTLNDFEYLRSTWLFALCGQGSLRGFKNRLTYLFHDAGLVERPAQQTHCYRARYLPAVYRLSPKGKLYLQARGLTVHEPALSAGPFAHNLLAAEVQAEIKHSIDRTEGLRFIFRHEILARAPAETRAAAQPFALPVTITHGSQSLDTRYLADAWFGIEYRREGGNGYRFFCLEVNHHSKIETKSLLSASHLRKFLALRTLREHGTFVQYLGISAPVIGLFVQTSEPATVDSMRLLARLSGGAGDPYIAFRTMATFQEQERAPMFMPGALAEPWLRVGHSNFVLGT